MKQKIVITGATGAIGMALIHKSIAEGSEVLVISHRGSKRNKQIPKHPLITVVEADLEELERIDYLPENEYNVFYHLAWKGTFGDGRNNMPLQIENIQYTMDAVKLAKRLGCHTFVGTGSQAEYGRVEGKLLPDTPAFPENGYGMAKLCAGQMSRVACEQEGLRHIWVRILSVYGPYDRGETMISSCLHKMLRGEAADFTAGGQLWDYLYSEDAAEALWLLGEKGINGKVYCIGSGAAFPLKEYILKMSTLTGEKSNLRFGAIPYAKGQVMELCADITALTEDTGFLPKTSFEEGIRKTIEWIKENEEN